MNSRNTQSINTFFMLVVFSLFAISSLLLVLIGANGYKRIVANMDENNEIRSSLSYVANRVHAAGAGQAELQTIDGTQTLVLTSDWNKSKYKTYIYEYKGFLMELFTRAENAFTAGSGDKITSVDNFAMSKSGSRLTLSVTGKKGEKVTMNLCLTQGG